MSRSKIQSALPFSVGSFLILTLASLLVGQTRDSLNVTAIQAEVVATGIPGAGAIAQIGTFHLGGPFHDNPSLSPVRVGRITPAGFNPLNPNGGLIARQHSVSELGVPCGLPTGVPPEANVTSK